jgi:PAS domain S-box-containing protein
MMEHVKTLNVAFVGGGPACKAIMDIIFAEKLQELHMNLIGVACTNPKAVGYRYAQKKGIYTTRDYRDLYKLKDLNMIIELTGREEVANEIFRTKPDHVRLMGNVAARLFWDVFRIEEERITERKLATVALQEREARLRLIVQTIPSGLFVVDVNRKVISWNKAAEEITGLKAEKVIGKDCLKALDCDTCKKGCALFDISVDKPIYGQECILHVDGKDIIISKNADILVGSEGKVIGGLESFIDISERKRTEEILQQTVRQKQVAYDQAIIYGEQLNKQMLLCQRAEESLLKRKEELKVQARNLEEMNTALKVLLKHREEDKAELEEKVLANVKQLVLPYVDALKNTRLRDEQVAYTHIIESHLNNIISPFLQRLSSKYWGLTPKEIQVATLIREGKTTKEIAGLLNASVRAVEFHRENIRAKLGLKNKKANLRSYLLSLQ